MGYNPRGRKAARARGGWREPDLEELVDSDPCAVCIAEDARVAIRAVDAWLRQEGGGWLLLSDAEVLAKLDALRALDEALADGKI